MIVNHQRRVQVPIQSLNGFLRKVCEILNQPEDAVTVCLVSEAQMARWNRMYRGKPGPTDVLSFSGNGVQRKNQKKPPTRRQRNPNSKPRANARGAGEEYLGDIAIAPSVPRRNASRFGRSFADEMRILILHGVLHLMGYDHETDTGQMDRREKALRRTLRLA